MIDPLLEQPLINPPSLSSLVGRYSTEGLSDEEAARSLKLVLCGCSDQRRYRKDDLEHRLIKKKIVSNRHDAEGWIMRLSSFEKGIPYTDSQGKPHAFYCVRPPMGDLYDPSSEYCVGCT